MHGLGMGDEIAIMHLINAFMVIVCLEGEVAPHFRRRFRVDSVSMLGDGGRDPLCCCWLLVCLLLLVTPSPQPSNCD